jgi:hypothetical protein
VGDQALMAIVAEVSGEFEIQPGRPAICIE